MHGQASNPCCGRVWPYLSLQGLHGHDHAGEYASQRCLYCRQEFHGVAPKKSLPYCFVISLIKFIENLSSLKIEARNVTYV